MCDIYCGFSFIENFERSQGLHGFMSGSLTKPSGLARGSILADDCVYIPFSDYGMNLERQKYNLREITNQLSEVLF